MKKAFIAILIIAMPFAYGFKQAALPTQTVDYGLGRVTPTQGKLVFLWNQPVAAYEVAFTFANGIAGIECLSPQQIIDASITNANTEAAAQGRLYDAIVLGTGHRDMAIVWKDKTADNSIARVNRTEGKYVFVQCEPLQNYDIAGKYNVNGAGQQILLGTCPGHQQKIDKIIRKANKDRVAYDAVMYGSSTNDMAIKFK